MTDPSDDLDELLTPRPTAEPPGLRADLFRRTRRRLVVGRRLRRVRTAAAVVAVFAAGGLAGWFGRPTTGAAPPQVVVAVAVVPVLIPPPEPQPVESSPVPEPVLTAAQTETKAELADDPAEAARLYRLAGDRYLDDRQDYRNAARCYRLFLARAGDTGLSPDAADSWLLTSLKNAAFKEKTHAANPGE